MAQISVDLEALGEVPEHVAQILDICDYKVFAPDGLEQMEPYENNKRGKCMACAQQLGVSTILVVDEDGIIGMWDRGECLSDMQSISFLREVEDNVLNQIKERE